MNKPQISVLLGSDSDLSVIKDALTIFEHFNISFDIGIFSAHRTPEETIQQVRKMESRGVSVFIAAAGGSAHLPGVIASYTTKPVIGLPVYTKTLNGIDSLYSIVQMPSGVPVATVGINAAVNAAVLAIEILAVHDRRLEQKLMTYKQDLKKSVIKKNSILIQKGWKKYDNGENNN